MKKYFLTLALFLCTFSAQAAEPPGPPGPYEWKEPYYIPMRVKRGAGTYQIMARYDCPLICVSPLKDLISRLAIARNTSASDTNKSALVTAITAYKHWMDRPLYYQCGDERGTFIPGPTPAEHAKQLQFTDPEIKILFGFNG